MFSIVIDQNVNVRKQNIILWAGFVEILVIDGYPNLSIFFGDRNNIGQPCRVLCHFHQSDPLFELQLNGH